jgi:molybdate transport system substrate-binding protein
MIAKCGAGAAVALALILMPVSPAAAAEMKALTTGAMKDVMLSVAAEFEKATGHKVTVVNDTAGAVAKRIEGGETVDIAINTPALIDDLIAKGKIAAGSRVNLATVGMGVAVKAGAPQPDIATVEAFKRALLNAKSIAYTDPSSGGSAGIYFAKLLERLGIADALKSKTLFTRGGRAAAERVAAGAAELVVTQISEIVPVTGVVLVGPLPKEIQNLTTYAGGIGAAAKDSEAARALLKLLTGPGATAVLKSRGMERPAS